MIPPNTILQNRYRVVRELGHGGMGTVYEAVDQRVNCIVALKETTAGGNAEGRRAFEREASLLGNLRHSTLPKVMDYFTEGGSAFLVMEFIPGYDLAELLDSRESPFPQSQVLRWAHELLRVLEYLHSQEPPILHRDIKPSNLKLTKQGEIFLLDFGLAKGALGQMPTLAANRSVRGFTPIYAPLEQIHGHGTDPRSDLYSLGATLYHLLTGVPPVDAPTRFHLIEEDERDPLQSIQALNPQASANVAAVIHQAMAMSRKHRPISATEMSKALRNAAEEDERNSAEEEYRRAEARRREREEQRQKAQTVAEWNAERKRLAEAETRKHAGEAGPLGQDKRQQEEIERKAGEEARRRSEEKRGAAAALREAENEERERAEGEARRQAEEEARRAAQIVPTAGARNIQSLEVKLEKEPSTPAVKSIPVPASEKFFTDQLSPRATLHPELESRLSGGQSRKRLIGAGITVGGLAIAILLTVIFWPTKPIDQTTTNPTAASSSSSTVTTSFKPVGNSIRTKSDRFKVTLSPDGETLVSTSPSVSSSAPVPLTNFFNLDASSIAYSPDGKLLAVAYEDGSMILKNSNDLSHKYEWHEHKDYVLTVAFSSDSKTLVSTSVDKTVRVWNNQTGKQERRFEVGASDSIVIVDTDRLLAALVNSETKSVSLSSIDGRSAPRMLGGQVDATCGAFSGDGRTLAVGTADGKVFLWNTSDGGAIRDFTAGANQQGEVGSVAFTPDSQFLAIGWNNGNIELRRTGDGASLQILKGHTRIVRTLSFSHDGHTLASGAEDSTIRLWRY